jgi:precorrin-4/cobalt-precorrin-4 C11-methyltransferase
MKVYFIGAGPGAADLITLRGAQILARSAIVLYAGSLVSKEMLMHCRTDAKMVNTAHLSLEEQEAYYVDAQKKGVDVARVHSGDPSIYGAVAEQIARLKRLEIEYEIVPGVSSFAAAAAVLGVELTKPEVAQTIILTRTGGRASPMPDKESLERLGSHGSTICVFLSGALLSQVVADLLLNYRADTPVALVHKASWPQEKKYRGRLGDMLNEIDPSEWDLSTMMIVGDALKQGDGVESRLYAADFSHRFRKARSSKS